MDSEGVNTVMFGDGFIAGGIKAYLPIGTIFSLPLTALRILLPLRITASARRQETSHLYLPTELS